MSLTINFQPQHATHGVTTGLLADMVARTVRNFQLLFTDASNTTWTFAALVVGFSPVEPIDGALTADATPRDLRRADPGVRGCVNMAFPGVAVQSRGK